MQEVANIVMGQSPPSSEYNNINIGKGLIQGNADIKSRTTKPRLFSKMGSKETNDGCIILSVRAPVGAVAISNGNYYIGRGVCSITSKINKYIYYYLIWYEDRWSKYSTGSTFDSVSREVIGKLNISIYSKRKAMEGIVNFLSSIDILIEKQKEYIKRLEEQKQGYMQKIFAQELRFKGFSGEWMIKKIGEIFEITRGEVLSKNNTDILNGKYPIYSSQTTNNGLMGYYNEYLFENAITWTTDGANAGDVNMRYGKFYCTNVCGVLQSKKGYANQFMAEQLNKTTHKYVSYVGNPKLMNNTMGEIKVLVPSLEEQNKIASLLSSMDNLVV